MIRHAPTAAALTRASRSRRPVLGLGAALVGAAMFALATPEAPAQVDTIGEDRFVMDREGVKVSVPIYTSHDFDKGSEEVTIAFIFLHGTLRNAGRYMDWGVAATERAEATGHTVVVSPQFLMEVDINEHGLSNDVLFWTNNGWKQGDLSRRSTEENPRSVRVSSYEVMDEILLRLAASFPNLERVVVAGHSAGGQFVNRYAAGSMAEETLVNTTTRRPISVRYIVSNPSSYVYICERRPDAEGGFSVPENDDCENFDRYKYGLSDGLNAYMNRAGVDRIRVNLTTRDVVFLKGAEDNDPEARYLDQSCPAMAQGTNRFDRGIAYHRYLAELYGAQHEFIVVPGVGHSASRMFGSEGGRRAIFHSAAPQTQHQDEASSD